MRRWLSHLSMARRMAVVLLLTAGIATLVMATLVGSLVSALGITSPISHRLLIESLVLWFCWLIVIAFLWYLMGVTIVRPLTTLVLFTQQIHQQDDSHARLQIEGTSEIALVADSINAMLDQIVGQRDHLRARVEKLVQEVRPMGQGDLRWRAAVTATDPLGVLATALNTMIEQFSLLILGVKRLIGEVSSAAIETHRQAAASVAGVEKQLAHLHQASTTVQ